MATLVQSITGESDDTFPSNPTSAAFSTATTAGNRILVRLVTDHGGTANGVTAISGGGAGSLTRNSSQGVSQSSQSICIDFWSGVVSSGATTGLTFTWSTSNNTHIFWRIEEWSGLGAFDKVSTLTSGSSTSPLSGSSGTLSNANSMIFGIVEWRTSASTTPTAGSTYTGLASRQSALQNIMGIAVQHKAVSATTAVTSDMTLSPTNVWGAVVAAYADSAPGGGSASPQPMSFPGNEILMSFW